MMAEQRRFWQKPRSAWTEIRPCFNAPEIHEGMLADIRAATRTIDFETYIFEADRIGLLYIEEFTRAAERGVKVRLLIDGIGSWNIREPLIEDLKNRGILVRVFRPFSSWATLALKWIFFLRIKKLFSEMPFLNRRDHRKLCLIDRKIAWVGSANICERHLGWRETSVRVKGPEMPYLRAGFEVVWAMARKSYTDFKGRIQQLRLKLYRHPLALSSARVKNKVGWTTWWSAARYRETLLASARSRIWIVSPYFIPTTRILRKILLAAKRGVDVRLLVPQTSDWKVTDWVAKTHYPVLIESGVKLFEYKKRMIHSKVTFVDGIVSVGSSNYNHRSLLHDFELDILIDDPEMVARFEQQWEVDLGNTDEVTRETLGRFPILLKIVGKLFLAFRFFM